MNAAGRLVVALSVALALALAAGTTRADGNPATVPSPKDRAVGDAPTADEAETWLTDARGRRMRVAFDPDRRAFLGVRHAPHAASGDGLDARRVALEGGVALSHVVDFEREGVRWKMQHDLLSGSVALGPSGVAAIRASAYQLRFLRWSHDGSIVVPTAPPRRLPFPFGVGFTTGAGRVDVDTVGGVAGTVGVADGELLLDLFPRREPGSFVALGVGPRYELAIDTRASRPTVDARNPVARVAHVVVPFSEPSVSVRQRSRDGHHVFDARAEGGWAWSNVDGGGGRAGARVGYEWVLVAVNDLPLAATAEVDWRYEPTFSAAPHRLGGGLGLRLGLPFGPQRAASHPVISTDGPRALTPPAEAPDAS